MNQVEKINLFSHCGVKKEKNKKCNLCGASQHRGTNCKMRHLQKRAQLSKQNSPSLIVCATPIEKLLPSSKEFYLCNELFIEFNFLDEESSFICFREIQKKFKPVINVKFDKRNNFVNIELEKYNKGLSDFRFVIKQLESLGNIQCFQLASALSIYQNQLSFFRNEENLLYRQQNMSKNEKKFKQFKEEIIPSILNEQDLNQFQSYHLIKCVDDLSNQICDQVGFSDKLINLLCIDKEQYCKLLLRQGWFDPTQYAERNQVALNFIETINHFISTKFCSNQIQVQKEIILITVDGIKVKAKLMPKIIYCFSDYDDLLFPHIKQIIGYLYILNISVEEEDQIELKKARIINQQFSDLAYQDPSQNFEHFQYTCSSQKFCKFASEYSQDLYDFKSEMETNSKTDKD